MNFIRLPKSDADGAGVVYVNPKAVDMIDTIEGQAFIVFRNGHSRKIDMPASLIVEELDPVRKAVN